MGAETLGGGAGGVREVEDEVCFRNDWWLIPKQSTKKDKDPREKKALTSHRFCVTVLHDDV